MMNSNSTARRLEVQRGICPNCAPHYGHAPGECPGDHRDTPRKPCKCRMESRVGKSQFIVLALNGTYFDCPTGIGPKFGVTRDKARRFDTQVQLREEMARWPVTAEVGCRVESVPARPKPAPVAKVTPVAKTPVKAAPVKAASKAPTTPKAPKAPITPVPVKAAPASSEEVHAQPFVKWAGGKRGSLEEIRKYVPRTFGTFFEPFAGGAAVFFDLAPKRAVIGDANASLMGAYLALAKSPDAVIACLQRLKDDENTYYATRDAFNALVGRPPRPSDPNFAQRAAWVIYLNHTCFNGLWRVNKKGGFNVPFDGTPTRVGKRHIYDAANLRAVSKLLRGQTILADDFERIVSTAKKGDFVYFDPPYWPVGGYADFTEYAKGGFGPEEQKRLVAVARQLKARGVSVLLSNADVPDVRRLYKGFTLRVVEVRRSINSKVTKRGKVRELLIT